MSRGYAGKNLLILVTIVTGATALGGRSASASVHGRQPEAWKLAVLRHFPTRAH